MPKITPPCKVWQWDINDTVTVEGIEDISKWQVHFATVGDTTALVIEIHQDMTAYIPNQLVELGTAIYAYLYNVREERAYTETAVLIPVNVRPKPNDYISEPTDVLTWGQLRADIGTLSQLATEDKTNLVAAVNELHGDIETACNKIDSIETTTTEQEQSITEIQSGIKKIKQSITDINNTDAVQSQQIAKNQQDIGELAQSDTQLAKSVSSLAQTVDKGFKQVQTELDKKQPAGDYITNAVDNLINYYLKSETYSRGEVKELIGSLTHINIEVISSIDDVTEPNVIYLVPVSGGESDDYYNEYILVNGSPELIGNTRVDLSDYYTRKQTDDLLKGKQPIGNYVTSVNGSAPDEGGNVSIDVQTYTAGDGIDISESGEIAVTNPMDDEQVSAGTTWSSLNVIKQLSQPFSQSGSIITCYPVDGSPLHVVSDITAVQAGTGDPSPENVRPIVGWDSAKLTRCGKNLLNPANLIKRTTQTASAINILAVKGQFVYKAGNSYTFSYNTENTGALGWQSSRFGCPINGVLKINFDGAKKIVGDYYEEDTYYDPVVSAEETPILVKTDNLYPSGDITNIQVELGSTATPYEPYRGQTYTADFPDTVYGGTLDWATGILAKTHEYIASYQGESVGDEWISSTGLLSTGAEVLYRLDEPEVIQLSPHQILAISGLNTIYCDTGDVTVTGYEDPRHTVAQLTSRIAALESAATGI